MASNYKFSNEEMAAIKAARRETKDKRADIVLFHIPPYTPEMNPIEQIWKEIRKRGFRNEGLQPWRKSLIVSAILFARLPLIPFSALPDAIGLLKRLIRF